MIYRVRRHVAVEEDILDLAVWIAHNSREAAYRFLDSVESSILSLRFMPAKGSLKQLRDSRLAGVRSWAVRGFPNHLILYRIDENDVIVFAVVHGARDYESILHGRIP